MRSRHWMLAAAAAGTVLGTVSVSKATLLAYDPFGYTSGSNITNTSLTDSQSSGFANQYYAYPLSAYTFGTNTVTTSSLTYPNGGPTGPGNAVQMTAAGTGASGSGVQYGKIFASETGVPSNTNSSTYGSIYISGLVQLSSVGAGAAIFEPLNTVTAGVANFGYNADGGTNASTDWGWNTGSGFVGGTVAATTATTLMVEELDYNGANNDTAELYINPTSTTSAPVMSATGLNLAELEYMSMYVGNDIGYSAEFDEFRIGTTFADVLPAPEPASMGLLGAAGAMVLLRRRRGVSRQ